MAHVLAYVPDLLFGSQVVGALQTAGHEVELVSELEPGLRCEILIIDLTASAAERIEHVRLARPPGVRTLAFYSHVETDVRERAERAGFDLVVPRSRMAREAPALVERVLTGG